MIEHVALALLLERCAPTVAPDTMRAVVQVESSGNPLAVNDNTTRRSYASESFAEANALVVRLAGDSIDVGIAQVNSGNFASFNVSAAQMLDPCTNLQVGSAILSADYRAASARYSTPRAALYHALGAYNTGSIFAGAGYVRQVVAAATAPQLVPTIAILTGARTVVVPPAPSATQRPVPQPTAPPAPTRGVWGVRR
jgi:type IV secretion system protein VirB1